MLELEDRLRKAGYGNVRRFWLKPSKPQGEGGLGQDPAGPRAAAPSRTVNGIRYKRADE